APGRAGGGDVGGGRASGREERRENPTSDFAVVGIYIYPPDVFGLIKTLKPSRRNELEITDVDNHYIKQGRMGCFSLDGYWTDAGTLDSLDYANELVRKEPPRF